MIDGAARGYYSNDGGEITGELYVGGDFVVDYYGFLKREATSVCIETLTDIKVFVWNRTSYEILRSKNIRTAQITGLFSEFAFIKVYEMALGFLHLSPLERYLFLCSHRPKVIEDIPEKYIASYIGIKPESLSRIKKRHKLT